MGRPAGWTIRGWIDTDGDGTFEGVAILCNAYKLLAAIAITIDAIVLIGFRRQGLAMCVIWLSRCRDLFHQDIGEEKLTGVARIARPKKHAVVEADVASVYSEMDMCRSPLVPAWEYGQEVRNAIGICWLHSA
jgi:hypothetical protein